MNLITGKNVYILLAGLMISNMIGCSSATTGSKLGEDNSMQMKLAIDNAFQTNENMYEEVNNESKILEKELLELNVIKENPYIILVNKDNKLDKNYEPTDLVKSEIPFQDHIETRYLDRAVSEAAKEMFDDAEKEGIKLLGASGYRAYSIQENMYKSRVEKVGEEKVEQYLAPPGASEHQTAFALDIVSSNYGTLNSGFEDTVAFKWLNENCYKYGFILRYTKLKEEVTKYKYEPWHYRYVGNIEVAKEIMNSEITLEEYHDKLNDRIQELETKLEIK